MVAVAGAGRADAGRAASLTQDLYTRFGSQVHAYCLARLRSREEAEDAVQTTFLNVFRALERGTEAREEQAWLFAIAKNVCGARRSSSVRRLRLEAPNDFEVLQETVPAPAQASTDDLFGLEDALEAMPENQRRAILLREWQGLSYREIATALGLTQTAVETLIFRGRRTLAKALEGPAEAAQPRRQAARRLAQGLDLGGLVAAVKTLVTGGAAVKAVVVAVAAGTATGAVSQVATKTLTQRHRTHAAQPVAAAAAPAPAAPALARGPASRPAVLAAPARVHAARQTTPLAPVRRRTLEPASDPLPEPASVAPQPAVFVPATPQPAPVPVPAPEPAASPAAPSVAPPPPAPAPTAPAKPAVQPKAEPHPRSAAAEDKARKPGNRRGQAEQPPAREAAPPEPQPQPAQPADTTPPPALPPADAPAGRARGNGNGHGNGHDNGHGKGRADDPPAPQQPVPAPPVPAPPVHAPPAPAPPVQAPPVQAPSPVTTLPVAAPEPQASPPAAHGRGPDGDGAPGQDRGHGHRRG
jgi:RNA polymerase sigma factor (sigma-70 family)